MNEGRKILMTPEKEDTEQLFETQEVKETPFTLIRRNGEVEIAVKNNIVTDKKFMDYAEAKRYIEKKPWELICITTYLYSNAIAEQMQKLQGSINKTNN